MVDSWDLMNNWDLVIPPSRPSPKQLDLLVTLVSKIDNRKNVAVLGSTIEYRDILYELNFENIFVFDRNEQFYSLISKSRIYQNKEIFVKGDWLETLEKYNNYFSLIVSDLTSGNIPYDVRSKFYSDIERALIKSGFFFDKILTHNNIFLNVDSLIKKYEKLPVNWITVNYFSCELLFCSELLKENEIVESESFYKKLESKVTNSRILKFIDQSKIITPPGFTWYYGKNWSELTKNYCSQLNKIYEEEDEVQSPYYSYLKIFCFRK